MVVMGAMLTPVATESPALMTVANAVAGQPTATDRLPGKTADASGRPAAAATSFGA